MTTNKRSARPAARDRAPGVDAAVGLDLLRTFALAARTRTFAEAAALRGVSTSAISQQIRTLEGQLGVALFERTGRGARLTPEGLALHRAIDDEFARIDQALEAVVSRGNEVRGSVSVGAPRTFATRWLRPRLVHLLGRHPELRLAVDFAPPEELERRLADGALDLALLVRPPQTAGLSEQAVHAEELLAVASPDVLGEAGRLVSADELAGQRYLVFDRDRSLLSRWWRVHFGRDAALPDHIVCQVRSIEELRALASAGLGLAILPRYAVADAVAAGSLQVVSPTERQVRYVVHLAWRTRASETARLGAVREVLAGPDVTRSPPR